jgi:hypothetical protein
MIVNRTKTNLLIIRHISIAHAQAGRLIQLADMAAELRQPETVARIGSALSRLGYDDAGYFYQAIALNRSTAQRITTEPLLIELIEKASPLIAGKAALALGTNAFEAGDISLSQNCYNDARRLSPDPLIHLHTSEMRAIIESQNGNHQQALSILLESLPVARSVHRLNHLNSMAVELNNLGRHDEARHYLAPCLASPYVSAYPEWKDTAKEIPHASRSRVVIEPAPQVRHNVVSVFTRSGIAMNDLERFRNKKKEHEYLRGVAKGRLVEFVSDSSLTEDQLDALGEMAQIFQDTNPDKAALDRMLRGVRESLSNS